MRIFFSMTYVEKLKSPKWQKKRLDILNRDRFTCTACSSDSKTLHVHHKYYLKGYEPWDYPDHVYQTMCEDCHQKEESLKNDAKNDIYQSFLRIGLNNSDIIKVAFDISTLPFITNYREKQEDFFRHIIYSGVLESLRVDFDKEREEFVKSLES